MCETRYLITMNTYLANGIVRWGWRVSDAQKTYGFIREGHSGSEAIARSEVRAAIERYELVASFKPTRKVLTEADL